MKIRELSVFFPAYNEEENLENTVLRAINVLEKIVQKWEIIIVNDGSTDKTGEIAEKLSREAKRVRVMSHGVNKGYGAAFRSGVYAARYDWIAFTDSDGQFDFSEITKFLDKQRQTDCDLVIGYYLKRAVPWYRRINTFLWEFFVSILFGLKVRDIDCGFKLFSKKVIDNIPHLESERGAFISSEFLIKAKRAGFKIAQVSVHHYPRTSGRATGASIRVILKSFIDLVRLWKKLH